MLRRALLLTLLAVPLLVGPALAVPRPETGAPLVLADNKNDKEKDKDRDRDKGDQNNQDEQNKSSPGSNAEGDRKPHNGGTIFGTVVAIDYQRQVVTVQQPTPKSKVDITVLPTTAIQGKESGYRTIADLARGVKVEIFTSLQGSKYSAQLIRLH